MSTPQPIVERLRKPNGTTDFAAMIEAANLIERMAARSRRMEEALRMALDCMESAVKIKDPAWDLAATPASAIGKARAALESNDG